MDASSQGNESSRDRVEFELETLNRLGLTLPTPLDDEQLAEAITEAGRAMSGAVFGALLYKDGAGQSMRYVAALAAGCPELPPGPVVDSFEFGLLAGVSRSDDLSADARCVAGTPFAEMPAGFPAARSCLAAPVRSRLGALVGGLFLGHPELSFFHEGHARKLEVLVALAAVAFESARLDQEVQEARAAAKAANGLKDAFLVTLSHELKTPLTAIAGWAHLLERGKLSPEDTVRAVDTIIRNANAQEQIIDELLDVSNIVTGKFQVDLQPIDLEDAVEAAILTLIPAARAKRIQVEFVRSPAPAQVSGDRDRLRQVFWNLLSNALKFTDEGGQVRVRVERTESEVQVVVSDTGVGIEPRFLPRVFDRFTQDDSSITRRARGLGLGLSIARQLVEMHGGTIEAKSAGPGCGSTFIARFPSSPLAAEFPTTLGEAS